MNNIKYVCIFKQKCIRNQLPSNSTHNTHPSPSCFHKYIFFSPSDPSSNQKDTVGIPQHIIYIYTYVNRYTVRIYIHKYSILFKLSKLDEFKMQKNIHPSKLACPPKNRVLGR